MKKGILKTLAISGLGVLASAASASALDIRLNTTHGGYTYGLTGAWDSVGIQADTTTVQYDTDGTPGYSEGDAFADEGDAFWTSFNFLPGQSGSLGLNDNIPAASLGYEVTVRWDSVTGTVNNIGGVVPGTTGPDTRTDTTVYTGGQFLFYFDPYILGGTAQANFGPTTEAGDDSGFTDGTHFMTIDLAYGTGSNTFDVTGGGQDFLEGSSDITGVVSFLTPTYLLRYPDGLDLNSFVSMKWLVSRLDQNTADTGLVQTNNGGQDEIFTVYSHHAGTQYFGVVPEPGTMVLLGSGLLGLAGFARKRGKNS